MSDGPDWPAIVHRFGVIAFLTVIAVVLFSIDNQLKSTNRKLDSVFAADERN